MLTSDSECVLLNLGQKAILPSWCWVLPSLLTGTQKKLLVTWWFTRNALFKHLSPTRISNCSQIPKTLGKSLSEIQFNSSSFSALFYSHTYTYHPKILLIIQWLLRERGKEQRNKDLWVKMISVVLKVFPKWASDFI